MEVWKISFLSIKGFSGELVFRGVPSSKLTWQWNIPIFKRVHTSSTGSFSIATRGYTNLPLVDWPNESSVPGICLSRGKNVFSAGMTEGRRDGIDSKSRHEKKGCVQFCDAS